MLVIPGYQVSRQIYESEISRLYQGQREADNLPVIFKVLKAEYPTPEELTRYKQEYELTRELNIAGAIRAYSLVKHDKNLVMVLEDFGGESLRKWIAKEKFKLAEFLDIAIKTAGSLGQIHAAHIIHKDINPSNIIYNRTTGEVKIIDFGISTKLDREKPLVKNPEVLEGTLAYISPEQTGRMNRSLDYRSDFYSLGVTFYELLTGVLPFDTRDPLEMVHCHIAKQPPSLQLINPEIPPVLAAIVQKLMAKTAEERYQSAWGLKADLERCQKQLESQGNITPFPLGSDDIADKFQIPQKLYGREKEVAQLLAAFERSTAASSREILLVAGYSGIGKSVLVHEVHKPIAAKRGYFIAGKFDQYQRNIPYSALLQAFGDLVRQLLTESETQLSTWRRKIAAALGSNGKVIAEVIPEVELIIGTPPEVPELQPTEAQNRFNLVWQNFIKVFISPTHPLVIFLDDLQWVDSASLKLMQLLAGEAEGGLFLLGAYRDNEVSAAHPLMLTLKEIAETGANINQIVLEPLGEQAVTQLIAETVKCSPQLAQPLAELVAAKTGGNPFFMNEFLKSLSSEGLIDFDYESSSWRWDIGLINAQCFTDNVVELMVQKIQKLPGASQEVLQLAAAIGNQFKLETLALVSGKSRRDTALALHEALAAGLLLPLSDAYKAVELDVASLGGVREETNTAVEYKFLHDRIQQAAYSLIPETHRQNIHQQLGQMLLQNTPEAQREEKIFDIVNQLNQAIDLIAHQSEAVELAQLNLMAGKKALAAAAYEPALQYLNLGISILPPNSWETEYDLTLTLHTTGAEAAYLSIDLARMEELITLVLEKATSLPDKVKAYEIKISAYISQQQQRLAVETALSVLQLLGVNLPKNPTPSRLKRELRDTQLQWQDKPIEDLINLPLIQDQSKRLAMGILMRVASASFQASPQLFPFIVLKLVNLSFQYGHAPESAYGYAVYGMILCSISPEFEAGYKFGQLALDLVEQGDLINIKSRVFQIFYGHVAPHKQHINACIESLISAYQIGRENGDIEFSSYAIHVYCYHLYALGRPLSEVLDRFRLAELTLASFLQYHTLNWHQISTNAINSLIIDNQECDFVDLSPNDLTINVNWELQNIINSFRATGDVTGLYVFYYQHLIIAYEYERYQTAIKYGQWAAKYKSSSPCLIHLPIALFYHCLAELALCGQVTKPEQKQLLKQVITKQKKLQKYAKSAPMNFLHKFYLVEAERYRVLGKNMAAMDCYDKAIAGAKENEYVQEEALGNELAAKFYLQRGQMTIAAAYMQQARYCYQLWGAAAKVRQLDETYPQLLAAASGLTKINPIARTTSTFSSYPRSGDTLDLEAVLKASQAISGEIQLDKLLVKLMELLLESAGAQKGCLILPDNGTLKIEAVATVDGVVEVMRSIPIDNEEILPVAVVNYVDRTGQDVVLADASQEGMFAKEPYIIAQNPKSILCAAIRNQAQLVGIIYLENNLTPGAFTSQRLALLKVLSSQAAISIENAMLYRNVEQKVEERTAELAAANQEIRALNEMLKAENIRMSAELEVTRRLQQMMLPTEAELAEIPGLEIVGFMEPAAEVGGDYYDVLQKDGRVKIAIGDVTGHGLESGMLTVATQAAVRTLLESDITDPVQFLAILNRMIYKNVARMNSDKNLTLVLLDYSEGTLRLSGQHEYVILVRQGGELELIDTIDLGFPIGLDGEIAQFVGDKEVRLLPGDTVVLYSDGITEAENLDGQQYGLENLAAVIRENASLSPVEVRDAVIHHLRRHIGAQKVYDDITLVVMKQK